MDQSLGGRPVGGVRTYTSEALHSQPASQVVVRLDALTIFPMHVIIIRGCSRRRPR